jgi:hypothetical protein
MLPLSLLELSATVLDPADVDQAGAVAGCHSTRAFEDVL